MKKTLFILAIVSCTISAQIVISSADISNMFAAGKFITTHEDTLQSTINIGSPGGGNNWDFTALQSHYSLSSENVNPATTPFVNDFPSATVCSYRSDYFEGELAEIYSYSAINSNWDNLGSALTLNSQPGSVIKLLNNPPAREAVFPVTFNSNWSQSYIQTTEFNGIPISTSNIATTSLVDAYGTMTLPGGASFEALRIRYSETTDTDTYLDYIFISSSGALVGVFSSDLNLPNSGIVSIDGVGYNGVPTTTEVEQISEVPVNYSLSQNYPNPFNPTTNIEYSIPEQSFVNFKVYDILGNEVAVLVNKEQSAGKYRADFSGTDLTSGTYFYRLQAGSFIETKKMLLIK